MSDFTRGDRALVVEKPEHCVPELRRYLGQTVTIVGALAGSSFYRVRAEDGWEFAARRQCLQKLPPSPPREETTTWERCAWRPTDAEVLA